VYNRSTAEQHLEKQQLPLTPTLHHHIITATTTSKPTNSATATNATVTATAMAASLLYICDTVVVI
jgi:hypothetical protein